MWFGDFYITPFYRPLYAHLLAVRPCRAIILSFADLEQALGQQLPAAARQSEQWWLYQAPPSKAALAAGFRVDRVDLGAEIVVFRFVGE